ncbi:hypothetical protein DHEL01_v212608 [Diaporthe helianthi]|uniref:Uncharacterized protein n=1 Tax=Diaporthe helianthi TaxID=158607 RepID=A0A2P5HFG4_DIAHE|nr:hypothetical protein DHEL01_v212608 [Diaporthe helianthi]
MNFLELIRRPPNQGARSKALLRETWPPKSPRSTPVKSHDERSWTVEEKAAVDIEVLIVRASNAHCAPLDPAHELGESTGDSRPKNENKVQLLRYSWYGASGGVTHDVLESQRQICIEALRTNIRATF